MPEYVRTRIEPLGNYSHAVRTSGGLLHLSGQVGVSSDGSTPGEAHQQALVILNNIGSHLEDGGAGLDDLVFLRVFVTSAEAADGWRKARDARLAPPYPASTLVIVAALGRPEWNIEVEAIAELAMAR